MTDNTKAISAGWIAPYYDKDGERDVMCDMRVTLSDDCHTPIVLTDDASGLQTCMTIAQAEAMIDALQRALADCEDTLAEIKEIANE